MKVRAQDLLGGWVDLTEEGRLVARTGEPALDPTDASEEAHSHETPSGLRTLTNRSSCPFDWQGELGSHG